MKWVPTQVFHLKKFSSLYEYKNWYVNLFIHLYNKNQLRIVHNNADIVVCQRKMVINKK